MHRDLRYSVGMTMPQIFSAIDDALLSLATARRDKVAVPVAIVAAACVPKFVDIWFISYEMATLIAVPLALVLYVLLAIRCEIICASIRVMRASITP